jgi:hypothetical protein
MKKYDVMSLALMGIAAGLLTCCEHRDSKNGPPRQQGHQLGAAENMTPEMQQFYIQLTPASQRVFNTLDIQHKMIAMQMANQNCRGLNSCRGLGGCQTGANDCAGQNSCEGLGGDPVNDPNRTVSLAAQKQAEKRHFIQKKMQGRRPETSEPSPVGTGR